MIKLFSTMTIALALSACSLVTPKIAPEVAKVVNRYCLEPSSERAVIRAQVNGMITPNSIRVTCEGDPQ